MTKIKDVLTFEFLVIIKRKRFLFITLFLVLVGIGLNVATVKYLAPESTAPTGERVRAAYSDSAEAEYGELLAQYFPEVAWIRYNNAQFAEAQSSVEAKKLAYAVRFSDGLAYDLFTNEPPGESVARLNEMVKDVYLKKALEAEGVAAQTAEEIMSATVAPNIVLLGNGENGEDFNVAGYYLMLIILTGCFMQVILYGKYIATSVVNEKASRTIEILFTCAKPTDIIFGKVFGVGLAVLAQAGIIAASFYLTAVILGSPVASVFASGDLQLPGAVTYIYIFIFFIMAFFSYSFLFAGFGAMSKEQQDVNIITVIPSLLCAVGFYIAIFGVVFSMHGLGGSLMKICAFTPFLSPLIMIARVCLTSVPFYEVLAAILVDVAALILVGVVSAKIYRKFIMTYSQKFSLRSLFGR